MARPDGTSTASNEYRYAGGFDGHLVQAIRNGAQTDYAYDSVGRLVAALVTGGTREEFDHDLCDNHRERGVGVPTRVLGAGNRLLQHGDTTFHYDEFGRLAERTVQTPGGFEKWAYHYDGKGLLHRVQRPDGHEVRFRYDAFGRRLEKRMVDPRGRELSRSSFVWDERNLVHEVRQTARDHGGPVVVESTFVFAEDSFVPTAQSTVEVAGGVRGPAVVLHLVTDPQGAPEQLVSGNGRLMSALDKSAFGSVGFKPAQAPTTPLRAQGQFFDEETGLYCNGFRYYDPIIGRYLSPDPIGLSAGYNQYSYGTNPIDWVDPMGLFGHTATASIIRGEGSLLANMGPTTFTSAQDATTSGLPNPENVMQSHTEQKVQRWARSNNLGPGDTLTIESTWDPRKPPCSRCRGAMNDLAHDTGATVLYRPGVGGAAEWRANPDSPRRAGRRPPPARRPP